MVSTPELRSQSVAVDALCQEINLGRARIIRESKIIHKSPILHPLARFVTEETVALLFNIQLEQIHRIECFRYVVYIYGAGVSRFVSYADFPPVIDVGLPTGWDWTRWRKRWKNKWNCQQAPDFWQKFYCSQFQYARSVPELIKWGKLVTLVKFALSDSALPQLQKTYLEREIWLEC